MIIDLAVGIIVLASSIWVMSDANKYKMGGDGSISPNPYKIAFACLILWIVVFPYYLIKRSKFIQSAKEHPKHDTAGNGFKYVFFIAVCLVILMPFRTVFVSQLPACDDSAAVGVVQGLVADNYGDGFTFSNVGQKSYDSFSESRECRIAWNRNGEEGVLNYSVEWYSDAKQQIYVQLK